MVNVVLVGCTGADRRTLGDEWRLMCAIVCVITTSAILISAQFFCHIICSWSKIKSPCPYVLPLLFDCRVLHTIVYCEAVWSAILAITWLLVLFGPFCLWLTIIWNGAFSAVENIFHWAVYKLTTVAFILFGNMPVLISDFKIYVPVGV